MVVVEKKCLYCWMVKVSILLDGEVSIQRGDGGGSSYTAE